jgi:uncharacterized damage-inducible protein DinB
MTSRELYLDRRQRERKAFVNVLKAIPQGRLDYRPDPKARTAVALAWFLAYEDSALLPLIENGSVEWKEQPAPATVEEIVAAYERNASAADAAIAKLDDRAWEKKVKMSAGSPEPWEDTLENFLWGFFLDAIHHRGQLTVYLRPMGSKVPQVYGPTADDPRA